MITNLLHLSDLHFGYDKDSTAKRQREEALDLLVKRVAALEPDWKPHLIAISGDLGWAGKESDYRLLAEWLKTRLFPATGLGPGDCVICPGNHDLERDVAESLADANDGAHADTLLRPERIESGFGRAFTQYAAFAKTFGFPAPKLDGRESYLVGDHTLRGIRFLCLNSGWFCRERKDKFGDLGYLWLGLPQLQLLRLMDPADFGTSPLTIALVHHPHHWFAEGDKNAYPDRPAAYCYLADRTHAILAGHTHAGIKRAPQPAGRAFVFEGGATYSSHDYRNNFSILRIDASNRRIEQRPWELDPRGPLWEEKRRESYVLSGPPPLPIADAGKYLEWLRVETRRIKLDELNPGKDRQKAKPEMDKLYIRLKSVTAGSWLDEGRPGHEAVPLDSILKRNQRVVIEGEAGSGKTTFLRRIAWSLCRTDREHDEISAGLKAGFPIWVRIRDLDEHIATTKSAKPPIAGAPILNTDRRWVPHFLAAQGWRLDEAFWAGKLDDPDSVLLLDGLDEAADAPRREDILTLIGVIAAQCQCHIAITGRPEALDSGPTLDTFTKTRIAPLEPGEIAAFLLEWSRWLKDNHEEEAEDYAKGLQKAVNRGGIRYLARNPLMLTALAVVYDEGKELPQQRSALFERILDWLARQASRHCPEYDKDMWMRLLGQMALEMQEWPGGRKLDVGEGDIAPKLRTKLKAPGEAERFVQRAANDSGAVTLRGGKIAFWHRSFQEYLAARALYGLADAECHDKARGLIYSDDGREVLPLLAGRLSLDSPDRLKGLFRNLLPMVAQEKALEKQAFAFGLLDGMLEDARPTGFQLEGEESRWYDSIAGAVNAIFEKGKASHLPLLDRVAAAEAVDRANPARRLRLPGDKRYWVTIPAGRFRYQNKQMLDVPEFQIGRFPVTVWEYGHYLEENPEKARPDDWEEQQLHPGRPVVYVSWHDANDYVAWLNKPAVRRYGLPTNVQWEFAARGPEGRTYPWGKQEPSEELANYGMKVKNPSPVGMFPDGNTPEGVADLAGNVDEWTASDYDEKSKELRGAGFVSGDVILRAAYRDWFVPDNRDFYIGFRCVRE